MRKIQDPQDLSKVHTASQQNIRDFFEFEGNVPSSQGTGHGTVRRHSPLRPSATSGWPSAPCKKKTYTTVPGKNLRRTGKREEKGPRCEVPFSRRLISIMAFHSTPLTYGSDGKHSLI